MRVALGQMNPTVGDLVANTDAMIELTNRARSDGAAMIVFGELAVCGYPPEDLVLKSRFVEDCWAQVLRLAESTTSCAAVVGVPTRGPDGGLFNAAVVCRDGRIDHEYHKRELPTYQVFDEHRWFTPGAADQPLWFLEGVPVGISICEDVWITDGPVEAQAAAGARLLVNLNASPFHEAKINERRQMLCARAAAAGAPIVYVNQVGGQDELVFDGGSMVVDPTAGVVCRSPQFEADYRVFEIELDGAEVAAVATPPLEPEAEIWAALVTGTRDYVRKNGFTEVVIGLSGGIDSSIVAAIAVDALGADRVHGVMMPSRFSSEGSISDAERLCATLGIDSRVIPIEPAHSAFEGMLAPSFVDRGPDLTEENLQSRLRGVTLMALSNKFGWMVLTTGNKSESAVGYSTLYGDTAGGLAVIKDVYKTVVYDLCRWRNREAGVEIIPETVLTKAPSAELRPDQRDDQSLPAYEVLDPILRGYVDGDLTAAQLIETGHDAAIVTRICGLVDVAEYKRRLNPPGLRVTVKAFGRDRRLPITNRYR